MYEFAKSRKKEDLRVVSVERSRFPGRDESAKRKRGELREVVQSEEILLRRVFPCRVSTVDMSTPEQLIPMELTFLVSVIWAYSTE